MAEKNPFDKLKESINKKSVFDKLKNTKQDKATSDTKITSSQQSPDNKQQAKFGNVAEPNLPRNPQIAQTKLSSKQDGTRPFISSKIEQTIVKPYKIEGKKVIILKPNVIKIAIKNTLNLVLALVIGAGFIYFFNLQIGLSVFFDLLKSLGANVEPIWVFRLALFSALVLEIFMLLYNFLFIGNTAYEINSDKLVLKQLWLIFFIRQKDVQYQNIEILSYKRTGIINKFFNTGTIVISMVGEEKKILLEYIDNVDKKFEELLNTIREYIFLQQKKFELRLESQNSWKIAKR